MATPSPDETTTPKQDSTPKLKKKKWKPQQPPASSPQGETPGPPTPAISQQPATPKETTPEKQKRLVGECMAVLRQEFPNLSLPDHGWLLDDIQQVFERYSLASSAANNGWSYHSLAKTRFAKWADSLEGYFQPSLAEMLAYVSAHKVLPHHPHDRFRCVMAEQHIVEKIDALLSDPGLALDTSKFLRWAELPFNVVNGVANVPIPPEKPALAVMVNNSPGQPILVDQIATPIQAQVVKREASLDQGFQENPLPAKRPRTMEEDTQAYLQVVKDEAKKVFDEGVETIRASLVEAGSQANADVIKAVAEASEKLATEVPSRLDSGLEAFASTMKQNISAQIQESVQSVIQEALDKRENAVVEDFKSRFTKLEDTLREEFRNLPVQDNQPQGYPVYCMPSVQLQAPSMGNMDHMGQRMIQSPSMGGFIQHAHAPRGSQRDSQQGGFGRRSS